MFLNYKFISKNISLFHGLLSFYIAFGFLLSEGHQKVLIGLIEFFCIKAVIIDESMPPDKKDPIGTSDTI